MSVIQLLTEIGSALTALLGLFVAYLAYRGYRRHESRTMRALSVGIVCIAVIPFVIAFVLAPALELTDAESLFGITLSHTIGLIAIYRTFDY